MEKLTERQKEILEFIRQRHNEQGFWPSIREVQSHFRFKSTNAVFGHFRALESKGALERVHGQARAFRVVGDKRARLKSRRSSPDTPPDTAQFSNVVEVPIFGNIAAGFPDMVESGDAVGRLQVDVATVSRSAGRRTFALRVSGESMVDAGINDGDTVVIDTRQPADGDIVVALIDGHSTLKRFIKPRSGPPYLKSENRLFPLMHPVRELIVQGVATALVRRL